MGFEVGSDINAILLQCVCRHTVGSDERFITFEGVHIICTLCGICGIRFTGELGRAWTVRCVLTSVVVGMFFFHIDMSK